MDSGEAVPVPIEQARSIALRALGVVGVPPSHAEQQIELLLAAEQAGHPSHGLLRLPRVIERVRRGIADPVTDGTRKWRGAAFLEVDGQQGLGPVVANAALVALAERAKETGVAIAAVRNNNHLGMLAWYAGRIARDGQITVLMSTSEALVHPWGGRRAMLGTNPIAIGVPAEPAPLVMDMATSLVSMGRIHDYAHRGRAIPSNWALDAAGAPTNDPVRAKDGALAPFGDAKGYALGIALEVLVAAVTRSAIGTDVRGTLDAVHPCNKGDVLIVIDPGFDDGLVERISAFLDDVRACPPADGYAAVQVPGDRARRERARAANRPLLLARNVWQAIRDLAGDGQASGKEEVIL